MNRLAILVFVVLLCASLRAAEPAGKTDRGVYPEPALPALPKAGETFVDPTFGTTLLRVTDEADGKDNHLAYSSWPTFNKDATRFHLSRNGVGTLYEFDPKAFRITGNEPLFPKPPAGEAPRWEDSIWSGVDKDVIFTRSGAKILSFNVATKEWAVVKDFAKELEPIGAAALGEMNKSIDDQAFSFTLRGPAPKYAVVAYIVWRRDADKIVLNRKSLPGYDEVLVDKSGKWLVVKEREGPVESKVVNLENGATEKLTDAAPDFGPGHSDCGHGTVVGAENWQNRVLARKLSDPHRFVTVVDFGNDWTQPYHISMLADDESWALISNYSKTSTPGLFHGEIFMVATDGSGQVRRLVHHRTIHRSYWDCPMANISRDGRFIAFGSNWGGSDRRDVFILRVPDEFLPKVKP
jgi:hypothetical protein